MKYTDDRADTILITGYLDCEILRIVMPDIDVYFFFFVCTKNDVYMTASPLRQITLNHILAS